jgi:hypothetical protein
MKMAMQKLDAIENVSVYIVHMKWEKEVPNTDTLTSMQKCYKCMGN